MVSSFFYKMCKISTVHGWTSEGWRKKIDLKILKYFDRIISPSESIIKELTDSGIDKNRIILLRNSIDTDISQKNDSKIDIKKEFNLPHKSLIITYIGRLSPEKGVKYLIDSVNIIKRDIENFRVFIVGDGKEFFTLKELVKQYSLEDMIIFTGYRENVKDFLEATDILVHPSLTEGIPLSILEAMYSKVPVIATSVGGIPEIIKDCENGILIEPENKEQIAQAVLRLVKDIKLRQKIIKNAFYLVNREFNISKYCNKLGGIYKKVLVNNK